MGCGIGIDPVCKGIQQVAKVRVLRCIPGLGPLGHLVSDQPDCGVFIGLAPIFRSLGPGLAIQFEQQIPMAAHLGPAIAVEDVLRAVAINVRNTIFVPQDFSAWDEIRFGGRRNTAAGRKEQDGYGACDTFHLCLRLTVRRSAVLRLQQAVRIS